MKLEIKSFQDISCSVIPSKINLHLYFHDMIFLLSAAENVFKYFESVTGRYMDEPKKLVYS